MMMTNLADILRGAGLNVVEVEGWRTRGHGQMSAVRKIVQHHTATSAKASGDYPSMTVVINGNGTTPGPLCNLGLGRSGTWYVVSAGVANHAGKGSVDGVPTNDGNRYMIGVEAEHPGTADTPWPPAQIDSYRRGCAALARAFGLSAADVIGHKEWAPTRKVDPIGLDMNIERLAVANYMSADPQGGIESMALDTRWQDSYGNTQTVQSFMAETQRDLNELHAALLEFEKSRIDGDENVTNVVDSVRDTVARVTVTMRMVQDLHRKVDELEVGGVDIDAVAAKVADLVADKIAERMAS